MQKLVEGVHCFQTEVFGEYRALFESLSEKQSPLAMFVTCSDSRIDPRLITQADPGDLFILRNAGNLIPPHGSDAVSEAAAIEFAISGLGVRDIIVCGHSRCGALKALLEPGLIAKMPAMQRWLVHAEATGRIMQENYRHLSGMPLWTAAAEENVLVQIENLRTHPAVAAALQRGEVRLHGWMYKIETGQMFAFDHNSGQFQAMVPVLEGRESRVRVSGPNPLVAPQAEGDNGSVRARTGECG